MYRNVGLSLVLSLLIGGGLRADFSYEEISKLTGGSILKMTRWIPGAGKSLTDPTTTQVFLKGNRLAQVNDKRISIIDIDKETMTEVDMEKKTYSVVTFAEMQKFMEVMSQRMAQMQQDPNVKDANVQWNFKVEVKETGATKNFSGADAKEFLVKLIVEAQGQTEGQPAAMNMDMVNNMWMAPKVAGYDEVQKFYVRMAQKMAWTPGVNPMLTTRPGMSQGLKKMAEETQKLEGIPVFTVTKIMGMGMPGFSGPGMPSSADVSGAAGNAAGRRAENEAAGQIGRASGGRLGGLAGAAAGGMLGGFGRKKASTPPPDQPAPDKPAPEAKPQPTSDVLMEMTTEKRNFSSAAVPGEKLGVPAGFKQVESEMAKAVREMEKKGQ